MEKNTWQEQVKQVEHRRWIIWAPMACAFLIVYFHRVATGVVADNLMREFNIVLASELGILSSIYFYTYAALQVPAGILADRFGPRRTITISAAVTACGAFAFGWATNLTALYVARFIIGLGVSLIFINIVKIYAEWFRTCEFGTMSGISGFIGNSGSIMAAAPLAILVESVGWRSSFHIIGVITAIIAVYCWMVVRDSPTLVGLPSMEEIERREGFAPASSKPADFGVIFSVQTVWANRYTWPPFFVSTCNYGVFMALAGVWGVPYFMQIYGMDRVAAANHVAALSAGYALMGPAVGYFSDRLRWRRWPFIICSLFILTGCVMLAGWNNAKPPEWALYPLMFVIGSGAAASTLTIACAKEVNMPEMTGVAAGTANVGAFVGAAFVQPAFGWMLDQRWQGTIEQGVKIYPLEAYQAAFCLCVAILVVALLISLFVKETRCINISEQFVRRNADL